MSTTARESKAPGGGREDRCCLRRLYNARWEETVLAAARQSRARARRLEQSARALSAAVDAAGTPGELLSAARTLERALARALSEESELIRELTG